MHADDHAFILDDRDRLLARLIPDGLPDDILRREVVNDLCVRSSHHRNCLVSFEVCWLGLIAKCFPFGLIDCALFDEFR